MTSPVPPSRSMRDLRALTPARVAVGRAGASVPTEAWLAFTLDHARARDAVHAAFDVAGLVSSLGAMGLVAIRVSSQAGDRKNYLRRPDLGRKLDAASRQSLIDSGYGDRPGEIAIVIGDGLSPAAVSAHAAAVLQVLVPRLAGDGIATGTAVIASGARVALGDEIGSLLGVRMVVMLIGERPGLSAPDSLGAYLTYAPGPGRTDAERNCVSNIHAAGLSYDEAAARIAWLVREGLAQRMTGVALKDESGGRTPERIPAGPR